MDDTDGYTGDSGDGGTPSFVEALLGQALHRGSERLRSEIRTATGKLDPHRLGLTGVVEDVPGPGLIELRVSVPGAKPLTIVVPYIAASAAAGQDEQVMSLVGHTVRLILEIDR